VSEADRELDLYRFLADLNHQLQQVRDAERAVRVALRLTRDFFHADEACVAEIQASGAPAVPVYVLPKGRTWEGGLTPTPRGQRPARMPENLLCATVQRRDRPWSLILLRRLDGTFDRTDVTAIRGIADTIARIIRGVDRIRIADVRSRIDRKMMEQVRPKDLFYQILDGLRTLTLYDHSGGIYIHEEGPNSLELVAEKITWRKARSEHIGTTLSLNQEHAALLETGEVFGFDREDGHWREWRGRELTALADLFESPDDAPDQRSMLCAPLPTRGGFLGVVKIASCQTHGLRRYEADLMDRLLPQAAVAIQNLQRTESLQLGMLEAERKHALANLARGVTHDINNAFGAVLPLVQQMIDEVRAGKFERETLAEDLVSIESSVRTCRRIFGGMLTFARGGTHAESRGDLRGAVDSTLAILADSFRSHGIAVEISLPAPLPLLRGSQADLEQLLLNLATNARDAMPDGGTLHIGAHVEGDALEIEIRDTGKGIAPDLLARVQEPFFTTKRHGHGLGLSICRSIAWSLKGRMSIDSPESGGTTIRLHLPTAETDA